MRIGHITKREQDHLTKQALKWHMRGRRRRGRPQETWLQIMKKEFEDARGIYSLSRDERLVQDRGQWNVQVDAMQTTKA